MNWADLPKIERELAIVFHQNGLITASARLIAPGNRLVGFGPRCAVSDRRASAQLWPSRQTLRRVLSADTREPIAGRGGKGVSDASMQRAVRTERHRKRCNGHTVFTGRNARGRGNAGRCGKLAGHQPTLADACGAAPLDQRKAGAACGRALGWLLGSTGEDQGGGSHHVHERRALGRPARAPSRSRPAPTTRESL
jgi:hypothetical protein